MEFAARPPRHLTIFRNGHDFELPSDWVTSIFKVADEEGIQVVSSDPSSTSVTNRDQVPLNYHVVTGDVIEDRLPWLLRLYRHEFLWLAESAAGRELAVSSDLISSVNLNVMRGKQSTYEWHLDSNPITALLYASTHEAGEGGQIEFDCGEEVMAIQPVAGDLLVFDATQTPHVVRPLEIESQVRISVPMNYYELKEPQSRPDDLDTHIYGAPR